MIPDTPIVNSAFSVLIGSICTILLAVLFQNMKFKRFLVKLFHKTPNDDIWQDVLDFDKGSNLKVYLKNKPYYIIGHHKNHEEKGEKSWLALSAFAKFDRETNTPYKDEPSYLDNTDIIITLRFSDIEHIEIF